MSETQVQIADEPGGEAPDGRPTPYQNLWVPLVIVPAGIVMAIVLVVALFGNLAGSEKSLAENLEVVATGGKNERTQALMSISVQASENARAKAEGREAPFPVEAGFERRLVEVIEDLDEDDFATRTALATLLATLEGDALAYLTPILALSEADDPNFQYRFSAIEGLGLLGDDRAAPAVLPFLQHEEIQLRAVAAAALANLEAEGVRQALIGALEDSSLLVGGAAAYSLAKLDPPAYEAAALIATMTGTAVYDAARERDPRLFTRASDVSAQRRKALAFLAHLGREEDWAHIESLKEDSDLNVREQVLALLATRHEEERP